MIDMRERAIVQVVGFVELGDVDAGDVGEGVEAVQIGFDPK